MVKTLEIHQSTLDFLLSGEPPYATPMPEAGALHHVNTGNSKWARDLSYPLGTP